MDCKRRDFFRDIGSKTAGIAACAVAPTMVQLSSLSDEIKKLGSQFNQKLSLTTAEIGEKMGRIDYRLDKAAMTMTWQQVQLHLIFLLLLISFAIDGGFTMLWVV